MVSYHSNPIFFIRSLFCHFGWVIAFPHWGAVSPGSIYEQISSRMNIKEICQVVNFSSDNNPKRTLSIVFNDFFPSEPSVSRINLLSLTNLNFFLFNQFSFLLSSTQNFSKQQKVKTDLNYSNFELVLAQPNSLIKLKST